MDIYELSFSCTYPTRYAISKRSKVSGLAIGDLKLGLQRSKAWCPETPLEAIVTSQSRPRPINTSSPGCMTNCHRSSLEVRRLNGHSYKNYNTQRLRRKLNHQVRFLGEQFTWQGLEKNCTSSSQVIPEPHVWLEDERAQANLAKWLPHSEWWWPLFQRSFHRSFHHHSSHALVKQMPMGNLLAREPLPYE